MGRVLRESVGASLVVVSLGALGLGVAELRGRDYVAATLLILVGLALVRSGVELLRPSVGE
jgi:hypothetical protein